MDVTTAVGAPVGASQIQKTSTAGSLSKCENFTNIAMMRNITKPTLQNVARLAAIAALASVIISFAPIGVPAIIAKCLPLTMRVSIVMTVSAWIIQAIHLCGATPRAERTAAQLLGDAARLVNQNSGNAAGARDTVSILGVEVVDPKQDPKLVAQLDGAEARLLDQGGGSSSSSSSSSTNTADAGKSTSPLTVIAAPATAEQAAAATAAAAAALLSKEGSGSSE